MYSPLRLVDRRAMRDDGTGNPNILVLDGERRLIRATASGRALLDAGRLLSLSFGRLTGTGRTVAARLDVAFAEAGRQGHANLVLESDIDRIEMDLFAVPSDDDDGDIHLIVVLKPLHAERLQRVIAAQAGFGLTPAETRLLAALFDGCSVPEAAGRLGVARSTARTHLQRVFDKTGARRQGDLLRLVACA